MTRVATLDDVPDSVAGFLASQNLPAELAMAPDPLLDRVPWHKRPLLRIRKGRSDGNDAVGLSGAFSGIAETATLMLASGADSPSTLNFLPDTHVVVLPASRVVGPMEDAWAKLRQAHSRRQAVGRQHAAHGQFHHRPVAHRRHRAEDPDGRARAAPAAHRDRRG